MSHRLVPRETPASTSRTAVLVRSTCMRVQPTWHGCLMTCTCPLKRWLGHAKDLLPAKRECGHPKRKRLARGGCEGTAPSERIEGVQNHAGRGLW
eukprot:scaffold41760_cov32-Tisochrysis_lutea.AAC.7